MSDDEIRYSKNDWQKELIYKHTTRGKLDQKIRSLRRKSKKRYAKAGIYLGLVVGLLIGAVVYRLVLKFDTATITIATGESQHAIITVEVADNAILRNRGLSGRDALADDEGMLFVWADEAQRTFWMKDTAVPLSVAFATAEGIITQIVDMQPYDETYHVSLYPTRYALEMRDGWFHERTIQPGASINVGGRK